MPVQPHNSCRSEAARSRPATYAFRSGQGFDDSTETKLWVLTRNFYAMTGMGLLTAAIPEFSWIDLVAASEAS